MSLLMNKKYYCGFRFTDELYNTDLIKDYFYEFKDRKFMVINIQLFNGEMLPCYINKEEHKTHLKEFNIYTVSHSEIVPKDTFTKFFILPKDNKVLEIPYQSIPETFKLKTKKYYVISEFLSFKEMFNKDRFDTHIINGKVCLLTKITYDKIQYFHFIETTKGNKVVLNSNELNQLQIVSILTKKKSVNTQQYIMLLCNILVEKVRLKELSSNEANWIFYNILNKCSVDVYNRYENYLTHLLF